MLQHALVRVINHLRKKFYTTLTGCQLLQHAASLALFGPQALSFPSALTPLIFDSAEA
jgi:hypothetical protein